MDIAHVDKGEIKADVVFEKGKIKFSSSYEGAGAGAELGAYIKSDYFLDKLATAIPGQIDDAVIALLKQALNSL